MLEKKSPTSNFLKNLSMFQKKATDGQKEKVEKVKFDKKNYNLGKTKLNKQFEEAVKQQEQQNLQRRNTVAFLPGKYNTNNVKRMSIQIADIQKAKRENEEKILKDIHEKKVVDNLAILHRIQITQEEQKKGEEKKKNEILKNYEQNNSIKYDIKSKIDSICTKSPSPEKIQSLNYKPYYGSTYNYNTNKASKNIQNNAKLQTQIDNNLNKIFGQQLNKKNLTFEEKYHLFDRKINNNEEKEKLKLCVTIKHPNSNYAYESKVYDENKKLLAQSEKQTGEKEIVLYNNLVVDYAFYKKTSYNYEIIKTLKDLEVIKSEMIIPLNNIISTNENQNYEKKIENLGDNEIINIGFDSNDNTTDTQKEKDIQLFFETKNKEELNSVISYSIQKDNKIIYKSPFCNSSYIKQTDKISLNLLLPEFEISFYNKNYDEQKIAIKTEEFLEKKSKSVTIDLPDTEKLDINISLEKFEKISLIKLKKEGLNINLSIAIDFTGSNGNPNYSDSLHYIKDGFINNYEKSIRACCDILSVYNKNDEYDVYGFGADVNNIFSECFNINNNEDSKIKGIENIIKEYKNTVNTVDFSGGTYFAPVIKSINNKIKLNNNNLNYNVLLIISDGIIDDIYEVINTIIESAKLPLSIVIIGVGTNVNCDMKRLNGENGKLISSKGECLEKDIVQYVHFNDYNENIEKLTQEVFRYIPQQIKDYFYNKN